MDAYKQITWFFQNLWKILTIFIVVIVIFTKYLKSPSWFALSALFFNLEGAALLGSAFSPPVNDLAASGCFTKFVSDCLQHDYPVKFNPVLFFLKIISLFIGIILTFCLY